MGRLRAELANKCQMESTRILPVVSQNEDDEMIKVERKPKLRNSETSVRIKAPTFDGKVSWENYLKQFETAARANGWTETEKAVNLTIALRGEACDVLQTIPCL